MRPRCLSFSIVLLVLFLAAPAWAGTKTPLFVDTAGTITAGSGSNSFEITDPTAFKCVKIEGLRNFDMLKLMRENYAGDGWVPMAGGDGVIMLTTERNSACPVEIGVYALDGFVGQAVTAYTEE